MTDALDMRPRIRSVNDKITYAAEVCVIHKLYAVCSKITSFPRNLIGTIHASGTLGRGIEVLPNLVECL
jgi:hypothetical protein